MTLDPMMQMMVDQMAQAGTPDFAAMGPQAVREYGNMIVDNLGPGPEMARIEDLRVAGAGTELDAKLFVPKGEVGGLIVFYHGGGWVVGSVAGYVPFCQVLAEASGCAILSIEYRLAPEHPFPTPVEDCYAATVWAAENMKDLLGSEVPLVVAGDSAGGNITAVVSIMARDRNGPKIACQVLLYPVTDYDLENESYQAYGTGGLLTADGMKWFWELYIEDEAKRTDPMVACLRAESLAGLPPAMVEIAGHDPLRLEGEKYADRLADEGTKTVKRVWYGLCHGFFQMATVLPPAGDATRRVGADLKAFLAGQAGG